MALWRGLRRLLPGFERGSGPCQSSQVIAADFFFFVKAFCLCLFQRHRYAHILLPYIHTYTGSFTTDGRMRLFCCFLNFAGRALAFFIRRQSRKVAFEQRKRELKALGLGQDGRPMKKEDDKKEIKSRGKVCQKGCEWEWRAGEPCESRAGRRGAARCLRVLASALALRWTTLRETCRKYICIQAARTCYY